MAPIDVVIVVASLLGLVGLGGWLASRQRETGDFYLGGRSMPAWALGLSLAANQVSAISLVGAPAFVALRAGGGLRWLQYELAVPLALAVLAAWGVPLLRRSPGASVYAAVEARLGGGTRRALAALFVVARGGGAGVILYASALVVAAVTGWSFGASLAVVGGVAVAYTTLGGLVADVVSDVAQFVLLWGGTLVTCVVLAATLPGLSALPAAVDRARLDPLVFGQHGLGDGATFAFWPMLIGGFFLYLSYYGCDQTQAQRLLAARTPADAGKALAIASFARFPLVCTYCVLGVLLAELLVADPSFAARLVGKPPDALVPEFLAHAAPVGIRGLAVAAILAAALSSIDSALNSLSAVSVEELLPARLARRLTSARLATAAWGAVAAGAGYAFSRSGETTIEIVNRVGSAVYGPTLAVFALAWRSRRADGRSAVAGVVAGVLANLAVAWWLPGVSWLWWNVIGFAVTLLCGSLAGRTRAGSPPPLGAASPASLALVRRLVALFAAILATLVALSLLAR